MRSLVEDDDDLAAEALAADPDAPLPDDAVPFRPDGGSGDDPGGLLPGWYMPGPTAHVGAGRRGWRWWVVVLIITSFVAISASGLCNTYGDLLLR